jgi:CzcA family heavy metal efflux pump
MRFLDHLIRFSLRHRVLVLAAAGLLLVVGALWVASMPVDIFPDLSAPTVTVVTEAPGMAPEEIEVLVTLPLESAVNGASGVRRLRSVSADGIVVIWVEFEWGTDIYLARQVVAERLQRVELPVQAERPELGPISSIMGEITFIALTSEATDPFELRRLAETDVRRALLAIPGISQVVPIGGRARQLQVTVRPADLLRHGLSLEAVLEAAEAASRSPAAGFHVDGGQEYLVRGLGRARGPEEVARTVVSMAGGTPVRIEDVADVGWGPEPARGMAGYGGRPAVVLSVQKQPEANTLELTERIDRVLADLQRSLPDGVVIEDENFRQADFIRVAIANVTEALRDGAILVVVVLLLFLGSWRTTLISALAIPLSLVAGVLVVSAFGGTINTMTLGGFTIAIGALVDDAIIDVENVFRRLRLEQERPPEARRPAIEVVFQGSSEVRKAILYATLIIVLVFLPLFFLPGLEGRLLRPLGIAYVAALAASLLVSLTVTPVLCLLLLPRAGVLERRESWVLRTLHRAYEPTLRWALAHRGLVIAGSLLLFAGAVAIFPFLGRSFLPPFNEGALTVAAQSAPGIPLEESDRLGRQVEEALLRFPEVVSTSRRTGRAEKDEHVQGVNRSEMEVVLREVPESEGGRERRDREALLAAMRREVSTIPGVTVSFGQPISHRIDHMISGSRTNLAVKVFGPDLAVLRGLGSRVRDVLDGVPGIVDLSNEEQASIPQLVIDFDRDSMARYGLDPAGVSDGVAALFQGVEVGQVVDRGLAVPVVVRFPESLRRHREEMANLPVSSPEGSLVRLEQVADVRFDLGPSLIRREDVQRVAMVTANVSGADLAGTVEAARAAVAEAVDLPEGYRITFGGQFEEAVRSVRNLALLSALVLVGMYGLLYLAFGSHRETVVVLVNLPLSLIGGIFAVAVTGGVLSLATLVGFVTLFGIATRNGVLLVSHYQTLRDVDGLPPAEAVRRGSRERLAPILMTALTAGLALIPLVLRGGEPGNEIQSPMGVVILGGLLTSTFLNLLVVPVLYERWSPRRAQGAAGAEASTPG